MSCSGVGSGASVDVIVREIAQFTQKVNTAEGVWSVFGLVCSKSLRRDRENRERAAEEVSEL